MGTRVKRSCAALLVSMSVAAAADEPPGIALLDLMSQWQDEDGTILDPGMFDESSAQSTEDVDDVDETDDVEP